MKSLRSVFLFLVLSPAVSFAYIPPTRSILQKVAENAGSAIYAIEQEVQFPNGNETLSLKETWIIENDRAMRLTVSGGKELGNNFTLQFVYNGGQKWRLENNARKSDKIPTDFLERYFNYRSPDFLAGQLASLKIIPTYAFNKKASGRTGNDFKNEPESWVRFSRTGGVVNYAMGIATPVDKDVNYPGMWIEQDQFVIRKFRLPSQVEVSADNYNEFNKGLSYPRLRTIRWGNNTATIRLISASVRPATATSQLQPSSLDLNSKWEGVNSLPIKDVITEFYTRFR